MLTLLLVLFLASGLVAFGAANRPVFDRAFETEDTLTIAERFVLAAIMPTVFALTIILVASRHEPLSAVPEVLREFYAMLFKRGPGEA